MLYEHKKKSSTLIYIELFDNQSFNYAFEFNDLINYKIYSLCIK